MHDISVPHFWNDCYAPVHRIRNANGVCVNRRIVDERLNFSFELKQYLLLNTLVMGS